ncbi:MAG TPA: ATP-binding protein [Terriglobia bacterium]|nr:ATP-binding protein [Terriglobia bacterium]
MGFSAFVPVATTPVDLTTKTPQVSVRRERPVGLSLKLVLSSDPRLLGAVRGAVRELASGAGFAEEDCRAITLAVDEALTNIIRHAYDNRPDESVELTCRSLENGLEFILRDRGRPVDPAKVCARSLEAVTPGGLGTHIIRQIMDQVCYEPLPDGNQLRLVKYVNKS